MSVRDLLHLALGRLGTGKLRTALTMLGVIIGVASVVALVAVGQGATSGISNRLAGLGTNLLTVNPGATTTGFTRGAAGSSTTLTLADATALGTLSGVQAVAPQLSTSKLVVAGSLNTTTTVIGTTPGYLTALAYTMWQGSFLTNASRRLRPPRRGPGRDDRGRPGPWRERDRVRHPDRRSAIPGGRDHAGQGWHRLRESRRRGPDPGLDGQRAARGRDQRPVDRRERRDSRPDDHRHRRDHRHAAPAPRADGNGHQ